jgi:carboxylesterase type B
VFGPIVDGTFTPEQPRLLFDRGALAHVPYLIGTNTDEGTGFTINDTGITDQMQYLKLIAQRLVGNPQEIAEHYPVTAFASAKNPYQAAFARAWGDGRLVCPSYDGAARAAAAGLPVFMYNFDMPIDGTDGVWGAAHAAEIVYVFGTAPDFTPETAAVSDRMQRYWTQLAKAGDPNSPELLAWPQWHEGEDVRVNFGVTSTLLQNFRASECAFWRAQYDVTF